MFRLSPMFFICFVGLSILTAFGIHSFTSSGSGSKSFASTDPLNQDFEGARSSTSLTIGSVDSKNFEFEDESQCSDARKVYERSFARNIPSLFRDDRVRSFSDFPRACMTFILNNSMGSGNSSSASLAVCSSEKSGAKRNGSKACLTKTYVNTLYNYFGDVFDCMGVPQKEYLPKIFNESGFQMAAFGRKQEAGLGYLLSIAVKDANNDHSFEKFKEKILSDAADKESCRNISAQVKNLAPLDPGPAGKCGLMVSPSNPLLNLFYVGVKYWKDRGYIEDALAQMKIIERMSRLGLDEDSYSREQLYQILNTIGFNAGPVTAVTLLHGYLKKVESQGRKLTLQDFNFEEPDLGSLENRKAWEGGFAYYLRVNQAPGTKTYGIILKERAQELNQVFKEGVCVPNSYLAL